MIKQNIVTASLAFYGMGALPGSDPHPMLEDLIKNCFDPNFDLRTESWCSAYLNAICKLCGEPTSGSAMARSWLKVGIEVKEPQIGDIVVFWRESPDSIFGHVGIVIRVDGQKIWTLGGNEDYKVEIAPFPMERVLAFRRLEIA